MPEAPADTEGAEDASEQADDARAPEDAETREEAPLSPSGRQRSRKSTAKGIKTPAQQPPKRGFAPFGTKGGSGDKPSGPGLQRKAPLHLRNYDPDGVDKTKLAPRRNQTLKTVQVAGQPKRNRAEVPRSAPPRRLPAGRAAAPSPSAPPKDEAPSATTGHRGWLWIGLGAAIVVGLLVALYLGFVTT